MAKIEENMTLVGFAWLDDDTGEINWAMKEDLEGVAPEERPAGCTPVIIEITPTMEWVNKKRREHEFLGDLQEQMSKFTGDLRQLEKNLRVKAKP
jgi:hypothetical protein